MKYNSKNKPLACMLTNNACYKETTTMRPIGVLWHSTGANNPKVSRYVQPSSNDANREELLEIIGVNKNKNDWNSTGRRAGVNAFVGKLANGAVAAVQTMPLDYRPWGCGSGSKGSCNSGWVQFEICEDGLTDAAYFEKVYKEACELTAYICSLYDLNPKGTVSFNGVKVPVILCHADSYKLRLGSNHADVLHWFKKHGKSMEDVREDVAALMGNIEEKEKSSAPSVLDWQLAAIADGFTFPKYGADGKWGAECEAVARKAIVKNRGAQAYKYKNLTKIVQKVVGVKIDGLCGKDTEAAIRAWQRENKLTIDGCIGINSWKRILDKS